MRMKKRGVSSIIAELLLIVITVAIGTLVYSFASTAFGGFGAGFSNLVQGAGNQLAENVVVEQVYFFNNYTSPCLPPAIPSRICATGDLFVRNTGQNTAVISEIFVTNVTANTPLIESGPPTGPVDMTFRLCLPIGPGCTWAVNPQSWLPNTNPTGCSNSPCIASIPPGTSAILKFYCVDPIAAGNVYAFTLITARGNQFVVYEKA